MIIDPAAIATLRPPVEASFTDIWLAGLSKAPHSEALLPLAEGDQLRDGQYRIVDRYMLGGQSTVYLAARSGTECSSALEEASPTQDKAAAADLVIKEAILPVFNDKTKMAKCLIDFENQTKLLGDLSHPGLVRVVDSFVEGSRGFVVMERVRGSSLMSIVHEKGAMEPALVLDLARQMCDILGYLHSQSPAVIHRDFTPDNLLLDAAGKIKLVDFGVAQKDSEHVTATVVGKHAYMPPEQFRGRTGSASDLYAMGATLYFLLTGLEPTPLTKLKLDDQGTGAPLQVEARKRLAALVASLTEFDEKDRPGGALAVLTMLNTVYETPSVEDAHTIRLPNKESMLG